MIQVRIYMRFLTNKLNNECDLKIHLSTKNFVLQSKSRSLNYFKDGLQFSLPLYFLPSRSSSKNIEYCVLENALESYFSITVQEKYKI